MINQFRSQMQQQEVNKRGQRDMAADKMFLSGEIRVAGAGESKAYITFPVKFSEKPHLSFGAEVTEGDALAPGFMPSVSVVILGWTTQERPPTSRLYTGAQLGIVTEGVFHQKLVVHWNLIGTAITSPS